MSTRCTPYVYVTERRLRRRRKMRKCEYVPYMGQSRTESAALDAFVRRCGVMYRILRRIRIELWNSVCRPLSSLGSVSSVQKNTYTQLTIDTHNWQLVTHTHTHTHTSGRVVSNTYRIQNIEYRIRIVRTYVRT